MKWLLTKSRDWIYERERRQVFTDKQLKSFQHNLACLKDFNGRPTWFLRLNPESIREIIFGLYTDESLRLAIRELIERPELQHVKLHQTGESETYTLSLTKIEK
jgi:hypothetical protein